VEAFLALGAHEICLTDVAGLAQPQQVGSLCAEIAARWGAGRFAVHLHDTQALGLANAFAAFQAGIRTFDTSLGGLGGCPFAPGSAGNLATEDLVLMLHQMGCSTGIDIDALWRAVHRFEPVLGRRLGGRTRSWYDSQQEKETT
jgi:hydroxymethylglutaryl-CoA lyase